MNRSLHLLLALVIVPTLRAETPHPPKPGSPERQTICDGARAFVLRRYVTGNLPQPIVFRIDHLSVAGEFANLEAIPLLKDGSYVDGKYIPDIAFNFCLRKTGAGWTVIADLSRTDVPAAPEIAAIRQSLPADFPLALFSADWRRLLSR